MVCTRRKGTDKIIDPKKCATTFSNRSNGLMKKANALHLLTGAFITLFAFFEGKFCFYCSPFIKGAMSELLPPTNPKEEVDRAEKERGSCTIKENCTSLVMKYRKTAACLIKKLKDFQKNPSVNAGAGRDPPLLASSLSYTGSSPSPSLYKETKKRRRAMQTGSSSPLSRNTKKRSSPSTPSPSAPKMVCRRRKGTDKIDDPKKCHTTFSKRGPGLTKKASALSSLTGALVSVIALSPKGEVHFFPSSPLQNSPKEVDWDDKEFDSCVIKEDCASLIMKYMDAVVRLLKKLKYVEHNVAVDSSATGGDISTVTDSHDIFNDLEDIADLSMFSDWITLKDNQDAEPWISVKDALDACAWITVGDNLDAGACISLESGDESRVGASCDPEGSTDAELHAMLDDLQVSDPELYNGAFGQLEGRE